MKRAALLLILIAGCKGDELAPGRAAILYQPNPAKELVDIYRMEGVIRATVGTEVTILGPAPQELTLVLPRLRVSVKDGPHQGVVGVVMVKYLRPRDR